MVKCAADMARTTIDSACGCSPLYLFSIEMGKQIMIILRVTRNAKEQRKYSHNFQWLLIILWFYFKPKDYTVFQLYLSIPSIFIFYKKEKKPVISLYSIVWYWMCWFHFFTPSVKLDILIKIHKYTWQQEMNLRAIKCSRIKGKEFCNIWIRFLCTWFLKSKLKDKK